MEKIINSRPIYTGKVVNLRVDTVQLGDGSCSEMEVVEHAEVVHIVAIDDCNRIILVRQFRAPAEVSLLETPAGGIKNCESPEQAAQRELREETGYRAATLERFLSVYSSPGFCTELNHLFFAKGLTYDPLEPDADERIEVVRVSLDEALELIRSGEIGDAKSVAAILFSNQSQTLQFQ